MADPSPPARVDPRKERARATRRRMVKAAYSLFCARGYGVPLTEIAAEAGVAVQTLYFTFHTKAALLREAHDYAVLGDDDVPPDQRGWFRAVAEERDMRRVAELLFAGTREILERIAPLVPVLQAAASADPGLEAFLAEREALRVDGYRRMIALVAGKGGLKPAISQAVATDIALMLSSPEVFRLATEGRGWTVDEWEQRTARILADALFEPAAAPARRRR